MHNRLSGKYHFKDLYVFAWPTIMMLVFMSIYSMVDGIFVARLIGTNALSAVNIAFPFIAIYFAVGIMLASGSAAIVARRMGEGRHETARENFTFMTVVSMLAGLAVSLAGYVFLDPLLRFLGATPEIHDLCRGYIAILLPFVPAAILQALFQSYFIVAGQPGLGLAAVSLGGIVNIVLDYVFIKVLEYGIGGAGLATGIGYCVPALVGVLYFVFARAGGVLYFTRPVFDWAVLLSSLINGSSEMITNASAAVVTYLFNITMLRHIGVDGVAALTIVFYAEFLLNSIYFGYATGVSPLFSYKFGRNDIPQLRRLFSGSLIFIGASAVISISAALLLAGTIVGLFATAGSDVFSLALHGMRLFCIGFVFLGFNVFFSALFTALSNGKISALLAFFRFVLIAGCIILLPRAIGVDGIWLAVPTAEFATILLGIYCTLRYRSVYHYA